MGWEQRLTVWFVVSACNIKLIQEFFKKFVEIAIVKAQCIDFKTSFMIIDTLSMANESDLMCWEIGCLCS